MSTRSRSTRGLRSLSSRAPTRLAFVAAAGLAAAAQMGIACLFDVPETRAGGQRDGAPPPEADADIATDAPADAPKDAVDAEDADAPSCQETFFDSFDIGPLGARWDKTEQTSATL